MRWRDRIGIAQRLRRDPILTIGAMEVAAEHAEAHGRGPGQRVEKWFLLDGIKLERANVSVRYEQPSATIESNARGRCHRVHRRSRTGGRMRSSEAGHFRGVRIVRLLWCRSEGRL